MKANFTRHHSLPEPCHRGRQPTASAKDKNQTYTDPKEVDADYAVQGEYTGKFGGGRKPGPRVIADSATASSTSSSTRAASPETAGTGKRRTALKASGATKPTA